jgi:hypothetical protein
VDRWSAHVQPRDDAQDANRLLGLEAHDAATLAAALPSARLEVPPLDRLAFPAMHDVLVAAAVPAWLPGP